MWIFRIKRNTELSLSEYAFIIKTSLRIVSDFVNGIRVMQDFDGEF